MPSVPAADRVWATAAVLLVLAFASMLDITPPRRDAGDAAGGGVDRVGDAWSARTVGVAGGADPSIASAKAAAPTSLPEGDGENAAAAAPTSSPSAKGNAGAAAPPPPPAARPVATPAAASAAGSTNAPPATGAAAEGAGAGDAPLSADVDDVTAREVSTNGKVYRSVCPPACDPATLRHAWRFDPALGRWQVNRTGIAQWCRAGGGSGNTPADPAPFPIAGEDLVERFQGRKVLFIGDSVARNSFVLTMARMCNAAAADKCMTRMPTYEYDASTGDPANRGPMGCVPKKSPDGGGDGVGSHGATASLGPDPRALSPCYREGRFFDVSLPALTVKKVPQNKAARRMFIKKGLIGPLMVTQWRNVTLIYLPINKPWQLTKVGDWIHGPHGSLLRDGAAYIVSIGPHLRPPEVLATPRTLPPGFDALRRAAPTAPILMAEFVHAASTPPRWNEQMTTLMAKLAEVLRPWDVKVVPQRVITDNGFVFRASSVLAGDKEIVDVNAPLVKAAAAGAADGDAGVAEWGGARQAPRRCGFYDMQHPGYRCQMASSELLLAVAAACVPPPPVR